MKPKKPPGRPFIGAKQVNISLVPLDRAKAQKIGSGSLSKGIRKAIRSYPLKETQDDRT